MFESFFCTAKWILVLDHIQLRGGKCFQILQGKNIHIHTVIACHPLVVLTFVDWMCTTIGEAPKNPMIGLIGVVQQFRLILLYKDMAITSYLPVLATHIPLGFPPSYDTTS